MKGLKAIRGLDPDFVNIGITDRHPMPVTQTLLTGAIPTSQEGYDAAFNAAYNLVADLPTEVCYEGEEPRPYDVRIYYSGLTELTLGVVGACLALALQGQRRQVTLMRYDRESGSYKPLVLSGFPSEFTLGV